MHRDGKRVLVKDIGLGFKKVDEGEVGTEATERVVYVRVHESGDDVAEQIWIGLGGLARSGHELGEMRVELVREGERVEGVRFTGVVGEVVDGGVLFKPDERTKPVFVKFLGWGDEGADDEVLELDEGEAGVWEGMARVGVFLYGDEFTEGMGDVLYLSVIDRDEAGEGGVADLVVLLWDEAMSDLGMRFVMLSEGGDWYEVWDDERLLRGYEIGKDGGVRGLVYDVVAEEIVEMIYESLGVDGAEEEVKKEKERQGGVKLEDGAE